MYPGRAFPIADVKTTTGKFAASGSTLTIKFGSVNVFEKWEVTKSGDKLHFHDLAGGVDIRCHSGAGDIFANLPLAPSREGRMKLSSTTSLHLSRTENVTLHKNPIRRAAPAGSAWSATATRPTRPSTSSRSRRAS